MSWGIQMKTLTVNQIYIIGEQTRNQKQRDNRVQYPTNGGPWSSQGTEIKSEATEEKSRSLRDNRGDEAGGKSPEVREEKTKVPETGL